ncbi:TetR/AcrR family transcriptional regulator [Microvirga brassicacearum]|uniref:TetR/AcrR family transcriptional regulator n=1 Tax=Microvirga brassicacearum TaxID=2580413 RepID=A0A5N3PCU3_9HYPH|nr:TetR/AcrR family transcriptional regulator [Microvirga brassicacearum]KAB0267514.1 TetR/AcrR family transcriptional regulator [Microvirga brassicacearum]
MRHWRAPFDRQGYHHGNLKEALIEAAQRFIAERGLGGFTLADAAKLVGVTPAALYRHFRGREALVAEVAFRGFTQLAERLGRALQSEGTPLERFTRMGEVYLAFAEQEPGFYGAMFAPQNNEPAPAGNKCDVGDGAKTPSSGNAFDFLVKALSDTFPEGFTSVDVRFIAIEVWALSHGIATLAAAGQLPKGPGLPDKYELLRAGVLALVEGARRQGATSATPDPHR